MNKTSPKGFPQCTKCGRVDITGISSTRSTKSVAPKKSAPKKKRTQSKPRKAIFLGGEIHKLNEMEKTDYPLATKLKDAYLKNRRMD